MAKTNQIKKLVNGEIADADDVNQIVENAGAEGGSIPYDPTTHQRDDDGNEALGSANYPWGDIFVNKEAFLKEMITSSASISASVKFDNLRKIIYMKDIFPTTTNSWAGHGGQFLKVRSTEDGIEPSAPTDSVMFTASGTFDVPLGITKVYLTMVGGGGGSKGVSGFGGPFGGGSGGNYIINMPVSVTPGGTVSVTVGAGGTGGVNANGGDGGSSSFGSISVAGGKGSTGTSGATAPTPTFNASGTTPGGYERASGNGGNIVGSDPGAGGGTPFGPGANGNSAGAANTGAGAGGPIQGTSVNGLDGGSGFVLVMY